MSCSVRCGSESSDGCPSGAGSGVSVFIWIPSCPEEQKWRAKSGPLHKVEVSGLGDRVIDQPCADRDILPGGTPMDAVTDVPRPVNEPVLSYAPGSPERAELLAVLEELGREPVELPMRI